MIECFFLSERQHYNLFPVFTFIRCQLSVKLVFVICASSKVFEEALDAVKFLGCLKKFGPAKNILGPVKGQSISERWEAQKACFCSKSVLDSYALWNSEKMKKTMM